MNFWLIQRGKFKDDVKDPTGIDDIIRWDYMGSAEFEFGALPKALKSIVSLLPTLSVHVVSSIVNYKGERLWVICSGEQVPEITRFFEKEATDDMSHRLKESMNFKQMITGKDFMGNPVNDNYLQNFWWDLQNNWMACFTKEKAILILDSLKKIKIKKGW